MSRASSLSPTTSNLHPLICLVGPTAVGKSALALELARNLDCEIIGVDAFQLYRDLPILTGQLETQEVTHHLIGILSPSEESDAMRYRSMALPVIDEVVIRKKIPLLVGGTGFYLKGLLSPLDTLPSANADLREKLAATSLADLLYQLQQLDPEASSKIDINNRRRVERVLEILLLTGKRLAEVWKKENTSTTLHHGIFLTRDRNDLHQLIEKNVRSMFERGVLNEVASLGLLSRTASMTLGLREIQAHLQGKLSRSNTIETIIQKTKRYAKRQMSWFRNQHNFPELNLSHFSSFKDATEKVLQLLAEQQELH